VDVSTLLRRAEAAVSAAQHGESGYAVYTTDQDQRDPQRLILAGELQQAIAHNQLTLEYQPQVDVKTGRTCGVEALVRWNHPRLGRMAPDRFIALAEQSGAIMGLTEWVVNAALAQQRAWRQMGLELNVAVNLSMRTLHNAQLPRAIVAVVQRYGIAPERVTLEITESALMEDHGRVREVLTQLAAMGLRLSIDDFGTGYSSLGYLSRLPVHELKIDRSFVREMMTSHNDATIVQSVIELGHKLGLQVVAEGVEQRTEWSIMGDWACDVVQGYYLSRPLGATDLERWLLTSPYGVMHA
jgi:EAL domain-containing protein (putative c-di-GMP-specific phosphodiesterase class I)